MKVAVAKFVYPIVVMGSRKSNASALSAVEDAVSMEIIAPSLVVRAEGHPPTHVPLANVAWFRPAPAATDDKGARK